MASGKLSPRQKMINMMYLVLTALLAMNVSSEILNAFKTIQNSIIKTNNVLDQKNKLTYGALEDALKDPQTAPKAAIWKPKADKCKELSSNLYNYIEGLKTTLKKEAGLKMVNGEEEYSIDNLDVSTRLLIDKKKGEELYNAMYKYKNDIIEVFKNNNDLDPEQKKRIIDEVTSKVQNISLDVMQSKNSDIKYKNDAKGWTESSFHMTPTIAAVTLLSKLQNDVRSTEAQISDYCISQLGKVKLVYDKFAAVASLNTTYCMPGDAIEISAGVGAFNDQAKPVINIGGANVPLNSEGIAVWKSTASGGTGDKSIPVRVQYTTPDGKVESKNITLKYTVGAPSGAALMLDKMNVFYIGLDNPITVQSGTGDDKTSLSADGGGINMSKVGPGKYNVRVTTVGTATITINAEKKSTPFKFRVKRVPDPIATIGGSITTQKVPKGTMAVQQGIIAVLQNFDFEAKFSVVSYDYTYSPKGGDVVSGSASGPGFPGQLVSLIKNSKPKDGFYFENVKVKGPDGGVRKIPGLAVTIQ